MEAGGRKNRIIPLQAKEGGQTIFLQKNVFDVVMKVKKSLSSAYDLSERDLLDHLLVPDETSLDKIIHHAQFIPFVTVGL